MQLIKCKLYMVEVENDLDDLAKIIEREQYRSNKKDGFLIDVINHSNLSGKYIEEYIHEESIIDPFDEETKVSIKKFTIINFHFFYFNKNKFILRIDNPPRGLKPFIYKLNNLINSSMTFYPINFDIKNILFSIKENNNIHKLEIKELCISNIFINKHSLARINIYSDKDAFRDFSEFFDFKKYNIDTFKCKFNYNEKNMELEIRKSGLILVDQNFIPTLYKLI